MGASGKLQQRAGATVGERRAAGSTVGQPREATSQEYDAFVRAQQEKQRQMQGATTTPGAPQPAQQRRSTAAEILQRASGGNSRGVPVSGGNNQDESNFNRNQFNAVQDTYKSILGRNATQAELANPTFSSMENLERELKAKSREGVRMGPGYADRSFG